MAYELHFTSAPKGLLPGTSGFCTVAATSGMNAPMIQKLELLSGYRPIYQVGGPEEHRNPVSFAHWRAEIGGRFYSILSRVCSAGVDYTKRSNKYAHHVVLEPAEQTAGGPAWMMMQSGLLQEKWAGEPRPLEPRKLNLPRAAISPRVCEKWAQATGDAGWAGVLADSFLRDASKPAYILYEPGTDLLPLIDEAIALLPEQARWRVTFNTFFTETPAGLACSWRCCSVGTPAAQQASSRATSGVVIDLTKPMGRAPDSRYVVAARTGQAAAEEKRIAPVAVDRPALKAIRKPIPQLDEQDAVPPLAVLEEHIPALEAVGAGSRTGTYSPRARPSRLFWVVAISWPIVVLGLAAIAFLLRGADATALSAAEKSRRLPTTQMAMSDDEWKRLLSAKEEEANSKIAQLEADQKQAHSDLEQARTENETLKTRAAAAEELVEALKKAAKSGPADSGLTARATPDKSGSGAAAEPAQLTAGTADNSIAKQDSSLGGAEDMADSALASVRWPGKGEASFAFTWLSGYHEGSQAGSRAGPAKLIEGLPSGASIVRVEPKEEGSVSWSESAAGWELRDQLVDAFGSKGTTVIVAVSKVEKGALRWEWKRSPQKYTDVIRRTCVILNRPDGSTLRVFLGAEPDPIKIEVKPNELATGPEVAPTWAIAPETVLPQGWTICPEFPLPKPSLRLVGANENELILVSLAGHLSDQRLSKTIQAKLCPLTTLQQDLSNGRFAKNKQVERWLEQAKQKLQKPAGNPATQPAGPCVFRFLLTDATGKPVRILELEKK